jgi:hypothetical protein
MIQTETYPETRILPDDRRVVEKPQGLSVLTAFEDLYEMLGNFESVGNGLSREALKRGWFKVYFHRYINPFSGTEKESPGLHEYKVTIKTKNFPARIDCPIVRYRGSFEGVEHGIKEDIRHLKSMGIRKIKYLGYRGEIYA